MFSEHDLFYEKTVFDYRFASIEEKKFFLIFFIAIYDLLCLILTTIIFFL